MAVSVQFSHQMTVTETLSVSIPDVVAQNAVVVHDQFNRTATLNASSTPAVSVSASFVATLSGGALTIDLTNMTGTNGAVVNANGLVPRLIKFMNPATNANPITIAKGASNGYTGLGATYSRTLQPGQETSDYLANNGTAVSGTVKTFDLTGTGSQVLNVQVVAG
jgi:hypothetical protein